MKKDNDDVMLSLPQRVYKYQYRFIYYNALFDIS